MYRMVEINRLLDHVERPGRYTGGEWGAVYKNPKDVDIRFAFCFPDTYEVGMSHLGMKILYGVLNEREDTYCERVFAPWVDMEALMRQHNIPLYGLESKDPICDFDFVGFTLQYELSYTNVLNMLDLAHIPLQSNERTEGMPFVCAGGPCAYNPEPLADSIDLFMMGEGEEVICELMDVYAQWKQSGQDRQAFLAQAATIEGVYVPRFYQVDYHSDGTISSITPNHPNAKETIQKRIIMNMDDVYYPTTFVVPNVEIVHDRVMLELFRGCTRGCRFCQAGMIYRPVRERSARHLAELAQQLLQNTGYEEISLTSLSSSDYTELEQLCAQLIELTARQRVNVSLPSLRIDNFSLSLMQKLKKSGLTFAPEAGTQRLRDVINKNITEEDIKNSVSLAFGGGYSGVKLYFMMGLPTETDEDILGISQLATTVADAYFAVPKEQRGRGLSITVSTSCFVPKPHTPFQWEPMDDMENLRRKQELLRGSIHQRAIKYNWHDAKTSYLEGVFARGDRRLNKVLLEAQRQGCKFDGWTEHFDYHRWMAVFQTCGIDPDFYVTRRRGYDEVLPWEHIQVGVDKRFLQAESEKARQANTTPQCREGCSACGAAVFGGGVCVE